MVEVNGRIIEENEVAHRIDENINYYVGSNLGYDDCWMFKCGTLSNRSQALHGFEGIEREIGVGILSEIKTRAIDTIDIDGTSYYVVPEDEVIDVYETYEHKCQ